MIAAILLWFGICLSDCPVGETCRENWDCNRGSCDCVDGVCGGVEISNQG